MANFTVSELARRSTAEAVRVFTSAYLEEPAFSLNFWQGARIIPRHVRALFNSRSSFISWVARRRWSFPARTA